MAVIVRTRVDGSQYEPIAIIKGTDAIVSEEHAELFEAKGVETEEDALRAFNTQHTISEYIDDESVDMDALAEQMDDQS